MVAMQTTAEQKQDLGEVSPYPRVVFCLLHKQQFVIRIASRYKFDFLLHFMLHNIQLIDVL